MLPPGKAAEAVVTVRNASDRSVVVDRFETSCGCVVVEPRSARIGANGSIALRVRFDPRDEPDFRGRLAVNLTGKGADETFRVRNLSSEAVTIVGATQTCTCVTTAGLPIAIPPRGGHDLHVTIRIEGKPSEQITQDVDYYTSSPGHRALQVHIRGQVAD